jgi:hypothetical protein
MLMKLPLRTPRIAHMTIDSCCLVVISSLHCIRFVVVLVTRRTGGCRSLRISNCGWQPTREMWQHILRLKPCNSTSLRLSSFAALQLLLACPHLVHPAVLEYHVFAMDDTCLSSHAVVACQQRRRG